MMEAMNSNTAWPIDSYNSDDVEVDCCCDVLFSFSPLSSPFVPKKLRGSLSILIY